jgi:hypothetical protein
LPAGLVVFASHDSLYTKSVATGSHADARNRASTGGGEVVSQFTTLAVGFAAFQAFTVDYLEAEARSAVTWNSGPPASIAPAIRLIWLIAWALVISHGHHQPSRRSGAEGGRPQHPGIRRPPARRARGLSACRTLDQAGPYPARAADATATR